jgi:hypothetical protein
MTMRNDAYQLNHQLPADHLENMQKVVAIELALGCSMPADFEAWPVGLAEQWNEMAEAGHFAGCRTLGDMSAAFLMYRAGRLTGAAA